MAIANAEIKIIINQKVLQTHNLAELKFFQKIIIRNFIYFPHVLHRSPR